MDIGGYFRFLIGVCRYSRSLADIIRYFILVEFSGILRLVDIGGNLRLMDLSGFLKFQFRVRVVYYRTFLLTVESSK